MCMRSSMSTSFVSRNKASPILTSQGMLEKKLEQIPYWYQNIFLPRSCIRSGLATQNLFTLDIHKRIFR